MNVLLALTFSLLVQQAPSVPAPPVQKDSAKPMSAAIRGRVLAGDTGLPLDRAIVTVQGPAPFPGSPPMSRSIPTDAQGRFELTGLAAGRYTVDAKMGAYVPWRFGRRRASDAGTPIDLKDGDAREKVDVTLPRGGVVAGRVLDEGGEPAAGISVSPMRVRYVEGRRQMRFAGGSGGITDDRGEYRIYGLHPGKYYLSSTARNAEDLSIYYPGTIGEAEAQPITVRAGQERPNTDILLVPARRIQVSGVALDALGRPMTAFIVFATNVATRGGMRQFTGRPDGTFSISLLAGKHRLTALNTSPTSAKRESGTALVDVIADDVSGVVVAASAGHTVSGQVRFEGEAPDLSKVPLSVSSHRSPSNILLSNPSATVSLAGTFEISGVSGQQQLRLDTPVPAGWMLRSVTVNGRDVTDEPFEVKRDASDVVLTLTNRLTGINGRVTDTAGKPVAEYTVIAYSDNAERWGYRSRFVQVARADRDGRFNVTSLPPDTDYLIVAVDYVEDGQEQDPDFLESLRGRATRFSLGDGQTKTLDLKIVKLEA